MTVDLLRLDSAFAGAKRDQRVALIPYLVAGYPDLGTSRRVALAVIEAGADVLELGVPFSDPLADGATIQRASERALAAGTRLRDVIALGRELRRASDVPLLLMGYANPFYRYGLEALASDLAGAGIDGVIVPDLPHEESGELAAAFRPKRLVQIGLVAPTTPDDRLAALVASARGFVYCVSLTGVTGARATLAEDVASFVSRVRRYATAPIAVGFGISRPEHVHALRGVADAVVVGSAIVEAAEGGPERVARLVRALREACA